MCIFSGNGRQVEWESLQSGLAKRTCRLWKQWDKGLVDVLHSTAQYVEGSEAQDLILLRDWTAMVAHTAGQWEAILGVRIILVEEQQAEDDAARDEEDE